MFIYKIKYTKIDSNGELIQPYKDKVFKSRLEAKNYLNRHPGAKGATIFKEEELIRELEYTRKEFEIFKKVERLCYLEDLHYILEDMVESNEITLKEYETIAKHKDLVLEKFEKYNDYDDTTTFKQAINYVLNNE